MVVGMVVVPKRKEKVEDKLPQALHILRNFHAFSRKFHDPLSVFPCKES